MNNSNYNYDTELMFEANGKHFTYWIPLFLNENTFLVCSSLVGLATGVLCAECAEGKLFSRRFRRAAKKFFSQKRNVIFKKLILAISNLLYHNALWFFVFG